MRNIKLLYLLLFFFIPSVLLSQFSPGNKLTGALYLGRLTSDPPIDRPGAIYFNTTTNKMRCYESSWNNCVGGNIPSGVITDGGIRTQNGLINTHMVVGGGSHDVEDNPNVYQDGTSLVCVGDVVAFDAGFIGSSMTLSNPLTVPNGGIGTNTLTTNGLVYGQGTSPVLSTGAGTNGQAIISVNGVPTWNAGMHYEGTGAHNILTNTAYFGSGSTVTRFVDPTNGNDSLCDGTTSTAYSLGVTVCAWASVQRAFDDIPNGTVAAVNVKLAAGTFAGANNWFLHSTLASSALVSVIGDCTATQATFTTTGAGAFVVSGTPVTKSAQVTFTPTVATGSVPNPTTDGQFWYQSTPASGVPSAFPVLASTGGALILVTASTTALASNTPRLCPWATTFSGTTTLGTNSVGPSQAANNLQFVGIKFTGVVAPSSVVLSGDYFSNQLLAQNCVLARSVVASTLVTFTAYAVPSGVSASTLLDVLFTSSSLQVAGRITGSTVVMRGTGTKLSVGYPVFSNTQTIAPTSIDFMKNFDFEGSGTAIQLNNGKILGSSTFPTCSGVTATFDITGAPIVANYGSEYIICGTHRGTYTSPSIVRSHSVVETITAWTATNSSVAGNDWVVGQQTVVATAALPSEDFLEMALVTNAANAGPTTIPVGQGGTGLTADTLGGHYERVNGPDGGGIAIANDTSYFQSVATVTRYVDFANGDDVLCNGKSAATSSGADGGAFGKLSTCAWKNEQRALDDIPNGYVSTIIHQHAAGTIALPSVNNQWVFHAAPGSANGTAVVRIIGDCTTPQAVMSSTGTAAFVVSSAGGGLVGGVTKYAQMTSTPVLVSGSIPNTIADADFWYKTTVAATDIPTVTPILASTGGVLTRVVASATAVTTNTPTICPWATVVTGALNIASDTPTTLLGVNNISISGIKFTGLGTVNNFGLSGVYVTTSGVITLQNSNLIGNYIAPGGIVFSGYNPKVQASSTVFSNRSSGSTSIVMLDGTYGVFSTCVFKNGSATTATKLAIGVSFQGQSFSGSLKSIQSSDIEGAGTGIRLQNSVLADTGAMTPDQITETCGGSSAVSFDVTGAPIVAEWGSRYVVCGGNSGKSTAPSVVRAQSGFYAISPWGVTNVNDGGVFVAGAAVGVKNMADLPFTDSTELVRISNTNY